MSAPLLGEASAASPDALPTGKVVGEGLTVALCGMWGIGVVCPSPLVRGSATVDNSSHPRRDIEDSRANGDGNTMLAGAIGHCVSGTLTRRGNAVDDGHQVFVIGWVPVALVANADVAIEKRKFEGFVLGAFEHTIRRVEPLEGISGHRRTRRLCAAPLRG